MLPAPPRLAVALAVALAALAGAAPARAAEPPGRLPEVLYAPPAELATLISPLPADLDARIERLRARLDDPATAADPATLALDTFAHERLLHLRDAAPGDPDHAASLALLEALELDALDAATHTEVVLALGLARAASPARAPREAATDTLREALERLPVEDATRRAAVALVLAERLVDEGEPSAAADVLAAVDDVEGDARYDALVTWRRAELAASRHSAPQAEKLLYQLVNELAADDARFDRVDPVLLDRIIVALAEAGAPREDGWVRTLQALDRLRGADVARVYPALVAAYDAGGLPMNRARVRLFGGASELLEPAALLDALEVVVEVAETVAGPSGTQLCAEGLALAEARVSEPVESMVGRCLELYLAAPRDPETPEDLLALYEPLVPRYEHLLRPIDRAHYGMALLDGGQTGFAREQLFAVDIEVLPEAERVEFARAAASLRHATNLDIRLEALSCTLRRSQPLPREDVRYQGWLETVLAASSDPVERYRLHEMALAVLLMNGRYEEALVRFATLLDVAGEASATLEATALETSVAHVVACLERADRWSELAQLTPVLRRRLASDTRERVFERFGATFTTAHLDLANALDLAGRTADGVTLLLDFQRSWRANPDAPELLFATGALLAATGEAQRAMTYYEEIFEEYPTHELADDALFAAALALRASDETHNARLLLERITTQHSTGQYPQRAQEILEQLGPAPGEATEPP